MVDVIDRESALDSELGEVVPSECSYPSTNTLLQILLNILVGLAKREPLGRKLNETHGLVTPAGIGEENVHEWNSPLLFSLWCR